MNEERLLTSSPTGLKAGDRSSASQCLTLEGAERAAIVAALTAAEGHRGVACRILAIDAGTLRRKILAHGITEFPRKNGRPQGVRDMDLKRPAGLTERQMEVWCGLASGETTKALAFELNLSEKTVEFHRMALRGRLGAKNNVELVLLGERWGICRASRARRQAQRERRLRE